LHPNISPLHPNTSARNAETTRWSFVALIGIEIDEHANGLKDTLRATQVTRPIDMVGFVVRAAERGSNVRRGDEA